VWPTAAYDVELENLRRLEPLPTLAVVLLVPLGERLALGEPDSVGVTHDLHDRGFAHDAAEEGRDPAPRFRVLLDHAVEVRAVGEEQPSQGIELAREAAALEEDFESLGRAHFNKARAGRNPEPTRVGIPEEQSDQRRDEPSFFTRQSGGTLS